MRCAHVQERLVLYLAGELTPRENARLIGHIARCAACSAHAEELAETQERMAHALRADVEAPATLDSRVMAAIRAEPVHPPSRQALPQTWGRRPAFAIAGAVCCVLIVAFAIRGRYASRSALDLASFGVTHNQQVAAATAPELHGSSPKQLAQQLTSLVRFPVKSADLSSDGAALVGGSRNAVENTSVATLRYSWQGKQISLFEMDSANRTPVPLRRLGYEPDSYYVHKVGDMAYVAWHSGGTDCVMVARSVPMHQLFHLACHACERQEQL